MEDENGERIALGLVLKGKWGIIDIGQFNQGRASESRHGESKGVSDIHRAIFTALNTKPESLNLDSKRLQIIPKEFALDKQATEHSTDQWLRAGYIGADNSSICRH